MNDLELIMDKRKLLNEIIGKGCYCIHNDDLDGPDYIVWTDVTLEMLLKFIKINIDFLSLEETKLISIVAKNLYDEEAINNREEFNKFIHDCISKGYAEGYMEEF